MNRFETSLVCQLHLMRSKARVKILSLESSTHKHYGRMRRGVSYLGMVFPSRPELSSNQMLVCIVRPLTLWLANSSLVQPLGLN